MRLGCLPKLISYHAHELLELTPALVHDITSLQGLQVQDVPIFACRPVPWSLLVLHTLTSSGGAGTCGVILLPLRYAGRPCQGAWR